jgi:putative cell wall-binding protein
MYNFIPLVNGKYKYENLPMGIKIAPGVFQNVMSKLVQNMEYVKTLKCHLLKLKMVLARLLTDGMRVNISKSKFFAAQVEYLGYWITRQGSAYT